jgi:hypothetical protein
MKHKTAWQYAKILIGIILTAIITLSTPLFAVKAGCSASKGQTVVRWKDMYWFPCHYSWNGLCLWPFQRKHVTYKVTITEGVPVRDEEGNLITIAGGKRKNWFVEDSTEWNAIENSPIRKPRFPDYEPIADNEYVVQVETRYRLFHNVEANLRICTKIP